MTYSRVFLAIIMIAVAYLTLCQQHARTAEIRAVEKTGRVGAAPSPQGVMPPAATKIKRYKKTEMDALAEYNTADCTEISPGAWTITKQPKYGEATTGTTTGEPQACPGKTFTFATIYYTWTKHSNPSKTDTFSATWKTPDGQLNVPETFTVEVPIVRPAGETTAFAGWADTRGQWQQTLVPPKDDPGFDFTGEKIKEIFVSQSDNCGAGFPFPITATPSHWVVRNKVQWGPDGVGWGNNANSAGQCAIEFFRCHRATPCGFTIQQQMQISSPADKGAYVDYGSVNTLRANIEGRVLPLLANKTGVGNVTSERAGQSAPPQLFPSSALSCSAYPQVDLNGC